MNLGTAQNSIRRKHDAEKKKKRRAYDAYAEAVRKNRVAELAGKQNIQLEKENRYAETKKSADKLNSIIVPQKRTDITKVKESVVNTPKNNGDHKSMSATSPGVKKAISDSLEDTAGGRAYTGFMRNTMLLGLPEVKNDKLKNSKAFKAGEIAGDVASYMGGYAAASKGLAKAGAKLTATKAGRSIVKNVAEKNVAKTLAKNTLKTEGKEITEQAIKTQAEKHAKNAVELAAKNIAGDATVGTVLDSTRAKSNGVKTKSDYAKYMAENAALNLAAGGATDILPAAIKAVKLGKVNKVGSELSKTAAVKKTENEARAKLLSGIETKAKQTGGEKSVRKDIADAQEQFRNMKPKAQTSTSKESLPVGKQKVSAMSTDTLKTRPVSAKYSADNVIAPSADRKIKIDVQKAYADSKANGTSLADEVRQQYRDKQKYAVAQANKADAKAKIKEMHNSWNIDDKQFSDDTYNYVSQIHSELSKKSPNYAVIDRMADEAADNLVTSAKRTAESADDEIYDDVKSFFRNKKIVVDDFIANDTHGRSGDGFNNYRKENFGRFKASKRDVKRDGINKYSIDDVYGEASDEFPGLFPETVLNSQDKMNRINDVLDRAYAPKKLYSFSEKELPEIKQYIKDDILRVAKETKSKKSPSEGIDTAALVRDIRSIGGDSKAAPKSAETVETAYMAKGKPLKVRPADDGKLAEVSARTIAEKPTAKERWNEYWKDVKKRWIDTGDTVYQLGENVKDKLLYPIYDRARSARTVSENMIMGKGQYDLDGNKVGESLKQIFKPIMNKGDDYYKAFQDYMFNRLNIRRMEIGKPVYGDGRTAAQSKEISDNLLKEHPEFKEYADKVYKYEQNLMDMRVKKGLVTKEQADYMLETNPFYVPTYRKMPKDNGVTTFGNSVNINTGIKAAKGSNLDLVPLHEQMAAQTNQTVQAALTNDFGVRLLNDLDDKSVVDSIKMVKDDLPKELIDDIDKGIPPKQIEKDGNNYVFNIRTDGEVYQLKISKDMFDAVDSLTKQTKILPPFYAANNIFRTLVTSANPLFAVRNGLRDFFDAPSFSKYGMGSFYKNYPKAWKMIISGSDEWKTYKALGGESGGFFDIMKQFDNKTWAERNVVDRIEALNTAVEQAPRFAEYLTTIEKEGNTPEGVVQALFNAHELTVNFNRAGTLGRFINANGITFFNAGVQDLVRTARAIKEGRVNRLLAGAVVMGIAPSVINELLCADDPNYQNLRQSDKDINFFIPIGNGKFLKVPKGRVVSAIAMPFQRETRALTGNSKDDTFKGMLKNAESQVAPANPFENNLYAPIGAIRDNKSWTGQPIENQSLESLPSGERTDENTTSLATFIGQKTGISPKKIDYVMKQYSGVLGQMGMPLMTPAAKANILEKNFVTDSVTNNGITQNFYDKFQKVTESKNSIKGTEADAMAYKYMSAGRTKLADYNKNIAEIQASGMNKNMKLNEVRAIREKMNNLAQEYIDNADLIKSAAADVSESLNKDNYVSENAYKKDVYRQTSIKVFGADATLKNELGKDYKAKAAQLKKADMSADDYYNAYSAESKYDQKQYYAKAVALVENGADTYAKANAVNGSIYESTYKKAVALVNMGFTSDKIVKLSAKKSSIDSDGNKRLSTKEIVAYLNSTGLSQEQKRKMFLIYANYNWKNPY